MIGEFTGNYRFLSNFESLGYTINYRGENYETVEHAYQAAKTNDLDYKKSIRDAATPAIAKKLGKIAPLRPDWEAKKLEIMYELLESKFRGTLVNKLLATANEELVEGNYWGDTFWGVCNGVGENHLGKLLMKLRSQLQDFYINKV